MYAHRHPHKLNWFSSTNTRLCSGRAQLRLVQDTVWSFSAIKSCDHGHEFIYCVKSETPLSLFLGGIRTHNLLIFGLTTKPSCRGVLQEDSDLPKFERVRWIVSITQALRMTDAETNFYICVKSETPLSLVLGEIRTYKPSEIWANHIVAYISF